MARLLVLLFATVAFTSVLVGCTNDDVGQCCQVLDGRNPDLIPVAEKNDRGEYIDDISLDPAFDCEFLTCVSYEGSMAYCTRTCEFDDNCPEGFVCRRVLESDPGPGSNVDPNAKYCVRPEMEAGCE